MGKNEYRSKTMSKWYKKTKGYITTIRRECAVDLPDFWHEFFECSHNVLSVSTCYNFDGPSGPTIDGPTNMLPSLFHDVLCEAIKLGLLDKKYRKYVDQLFRQHLLKAGMKPWRVWAYYQGVRLWSRFKGIKNGIYRNAD